MCTGKDYPIVRLRVCDMLLTHHHQAILENHKLLLQMNWTTLILQSHVS